MNTTRRRWPPVARPLLVALCGAYAWIFDPYATAAPAGPIPLCRESATDLCGFDRPEDLASLTGEGTTGDRWVLIAQKNPDAPLVWLDTQSNRRVIAAATGASRCGGHPSNIDAGGIDIDRRGRYAAVINHTAPQRIDLFAIRKTKPTPQLQWLRCLPLPANFAPNDVAVDDASTVYVTHMFDKPHSPAESRELEQRFASGAPTGYAIRSLAAGRWEKVPHSDASFANGIAISSDGRWLAVAGTFDQSLHLLDLQGRADPRRVALPLQPDNVTAHGESGFTIAGHTGVPRSGVDPCRPRDATPCGFPFAIADVAATDASVRVIHEDNGHRTPGASVALHVGEQLLLGSAFGDRVSLRTPARPFRHVTVQGGGGVPIEVIETGNPEGPPILFVHGMSQSHLAWLPQLRSELAQRFRLVAFDLRGHGASGKPWRSEDYADSKSWADDIDAVLRALQLERTVIVAWSYGGHAVMSYVRHYGTSRIAALDFTGTLAGLRTVAREPGSDTERLLAGSRLRASPDLEDNIAGYRAMAGGLTAAPLSPELDEIAFVTGLMQPSYVRRAMTRLPTQNADLIPTLTMPVLLSMGELDREWPIAECRALREALPAATLTVYLGRGHFPSAEEPARFNAELAALVERVTTPRQSPMR